MNKTRILIVSSLTKRERKVAETYQQPFYGYSHTICSSRDIFSLNDFSRYFNSASQAGQVPRQSPL
jgi:hypothetical protein